MLGALIIVFREVIEAGLVVGIVMAATRGVPRRFGWIAGGVAVGLGIAGLVAAFAGSIADSFQGVGQELFSAVVLAAAIVMLMWHNAWMAAHGRQMGESFKRLGADVSAGARPLAALAVVVGAAVLREGAEVVLFLYGIIASGTSEAALLAGGLLGVAGGAALSALTYFGLISIPSRYVFSVTTWLITLLAAGMAAQAVQFLASAQVLTVLDSVVWDTSSLLSEKSIAGRVLHALVGYADRPTQMQVLAYAATLLAGLLLTRFAGRTVASART